MMVLLCWVSNVHYFTLKCEDQNVKYLSSGYGCVGYTCILFIIYAYKWIYTEKYWWNKMHIFTVKIYITYFLYLHWSPARVLSSNILINKCNIK